MLIFILGATGAGKTTMMSKARELGYDTVEVGKMLRAKYPPEYFEGSAAPEKTRQEALDIMIKGIEASEAEYTFVDGQPREVVQVDFIMEHYPDATFILLDCPTDIRLERLIGRDSADEKRMELAKARLEGDYVSMFPVISRLLAYDVKIHSFDTSEVSLDEIIECIPWL